MKQEIIKHLESFAITFVATFLIAISPDLFEAGMVSMADGTLAATAIAVARSSVKIAYQLALLPLLQKLAQGKKE